MSKAPQNDQTERAEIEVITNALVRIGAPAVPALLRASSEADAASEQIASALARIASQATAPLIDALEAESEQTRAGAANAIAAMTPIPTAALVPLNQCLDDPSPLVRGATIKALSKQQGGTQAWTDRLFSFTRDPQALIRKTAVECLNDTLDPNTTLDQLSSLLKDDDANVRLAVAQALGGSTVRLMRFCSRCLPPAPMRIRMSVKQSSMRSQKVKIDPTM